VIQGGSGVFENSNALNSSIHFTNVTATVNGSLIQSSPISLLGSTFTLQNSVVDCCGDDHSVNDFPISLESSNMTISNSLMVDNSTSSSDWSVNCVKNSSNWVSGDLLGWSIAPQCQTRYNPLTITRSTEFELLMMGSIELIEIVLSEENSGVNVTLSLTSISTNATTLVDNKMIEPAPIQPLRVTMHLTRSGCLQDIQFSSDSSLTSSTSTQNNSSYVSSVNIGFDGPSPLFLEPSSNGTTVYCLMINSSSPISYNAVINVNAQLIDRMLHSSSLELTPKYAVYSYVIAADYEFYDQWGVPFISMDEVTLYCKNGTSSCGHTTAMSSSGRILVSLNETLETSWKLFTSVNASLSVPNSQPSKAYGNYKMNVI